MVAPGVAHCIVTRWLTAEVPAAGKAVGVAGMTVLSIDVLCAVYLGGSMKYELGMMNWELR